MIQNYNNMYTKMNNETIDAINSAKVEEKQERRKTLYIPGQKTGKWEEQEQLRYIAFLDFNKELMRSREKRSSNKFYEQMADFIETRNALQCRSHHQKLQQKYSHFTKIIKRYKKSFNKTLYRQNILNLEKSNIKNIRFQMKNPQDYDIQQSNNNIQVQTDLCGIQKKFVIIKPNEIKIEEPEFNSGVSMPYKNYFTPNTNGMMYNAHLQYYQPYMNPYYPHFAYQNIIPYQ